MNPWTGLNILLALLAAALFALTLIPGAGEQRMLLAEIDAADVAQLRVERNDRLRLHLLRDGEGWMMRFPDRVAADPARVQRLLAVARAPVVQSFPATGPLARYGLDRPAVAISFDEHRLTFGGTDPSGTRRYVRHGERIYLVDSLFFNLVMLPAEHFHGS